MAQITAAYWRYADHGKGDFPEGDDFDDFYSEHRNLLREDVWQNFYTLDFLLEETSAQFYRLPNLQDLPDTTGELGKPRRQNQIGHFSKLPRWAHLVVRTYHKKKPALSATVVAQIATSTLQQSINRLLENSATQVQPYSETQAFFWLTTLGLFSHRDPDLEYLWDPRFPFGGEIAVGQRDLWAWEAHYSPELWWSSADEPVRLEPDLDGTRRSSVDGCGCGWPEGWGVVSEAWTSGWDPEVGSAEEVAFLAGVALEETKGLLSEADGGGGTPNYAMRSHILLGVLSAAFEADAEREARATQMAKAMVEAGRLANEAAAEEWIQRAMEAASRYANELDGVRPEGPDWAAVFRKMLEENGQLFWQWVPRKQEEKSKEFNFRLSPPIKLGEK